MIYKKREWALITAFILCTVFYTSQFSFMAGMQVNPEKLMQVYAFSILGHLFGILVLPLLLPFRDLRQGRRPAHYTLRLVLTSLFFLPNLIVRLLGPQAWLESQFNSVFMAFGNGVVIILLKGCFFTLAGRNRVFWASLSLSAGTFVFNLIMGPLRQLLLPLSFIGSGLVLTTAGVLLFVFLSAKQNEQTANTKLPLATVPPAPLNDGITGGIRRSGAPLFLFPVFAVLVIFFANSFTDQLFLFVLNTPLSHGFNIPVLFMILILPLLCFFASLSWRRFLMVFILLCGVIFLLAPSMLLFSRSQPLFPFLYTIKVMAIRMITVVFPFLIVDLYWQYAGQKNSGGYWGWLLAASVHIIYTNVVNVSDLIDFRRIDDGYATALLTFAAMAFIVLSYKTITLKPYGNIVSKASQQNPNIGGILREYNLSDRETEVALLMIREGLSDKEIGERLFISPLTVRTHITQIYRKFGVKRSAELLAKVFNKQ